MTFRFEVSESPQMKGVTLEDVSSFKTSDWVHER